ncbi:MAG TPA: amidohydrolase family protein [Gemmatimonadaceae bacterium]|nr:amidohydrolase family protein [Gemmatimonadaceae bacterium]
MASNRSLKSQMRRAVGVACLAGCSDAGGQVLAFTNVSVVDGRDSLPRPDQTVIVSGRRIVTSTAASSARVPAGARVIDGRGKYLIPGLWDMHVHTVTPGGRYLLGLYVANGVTGVRDMVSDWTAIGAWRREITSGRLIGPRIVASGPYLEGGPSPIAHILARTPDQGRAGVDSLVALGVDFVKVHGQLDPETYFAIARRARERGIAFAGHVSSAVGAAAASDSGQRSIEHMLGIPIPCTAADSVSLAPRFSVQTLLGRCTSTDLAPLYARLSRNGTWVTPTLVAAVEISRWPSRDLPGDSLAGYLPDSIKQFVREIFPMPAGIPAGADATGRALFSKRLAQVMALHRAGVGILAGTDAPLRNSPPGFGLHEELLMLTRAGLSNIDALRAATSGPARYFGMDSLGTVEAGKVADLVLLDANPLDDIRNTRRIAAVMANGRLIEGRERSRLLVPKDP